MQQQNPKTKATPTKRRQNRRPANSPATKSYASENDAHHEPAFAPGYSHGSPFTPLKSASNSPAPAAQTANSKSKPRNGGARTRPKNVPSSPGPARQEHKTPPNSGIPKQSSTTAFAGATFHASPAPSSLPIPSFLAKAMDSPSLKLAEQTRQEPSPPATDSGAPTPQRASSLSKSAMDESPLDFFFRADRAERERSHHASATRPSAIATAALSPPRTAFRSPPATQPVRSNPAIFTRRASFQRSSSLGIPPAELDGTPGRPMGPAFSTPYQDRIRAARSSEHHAAPSSATPPRPQPQNPSVDRGEALKQFLSLGSPKPSAQARPGHQPALSSLGSRRDPFKGAPSPQAQQTTATGLSARQDVDRAPNIVEMEDSLRRILKLNPESSNP